MISSSLEAFFFKPWYFQAFFIFIIVFVFSFTFYYSFLEHQMRDINIKLLDNNQLIKRLTDEKKRYKALKINEFLASSYAKEYHYLKLSMSYQNNLFLLNHLANSLIRENVTLKNMVFKGENREASYRTLLLQLNLIGNYESLKKSFFLFVQLPYLINIEQFKMEKFNQENEEGKVYVDMLVKIYLFK